VLLFDREGNARRERERAYLAHHLSVAARWRHHSSGSASPIRRQRPAVASKSHRHCTLMRSTPPRKHATPHSHYFQKTAKNTRKTHSHATRVSPATLTPTTSHARQINGLRQPSQRESRATPREQAFPAQTQRESTPGARKRRVPRPPPKKSRVPPFQNARRPLTRSHVAHSNAVFSHNALVNFLAQMDQRCSRYGGSPEWPVFPQNRPFPRGGRSAQEKQREAEGERDDTTPPHHTPRTPFTTHHTHHQRRKGRRTQQRAICWLVAGFDRPFSSTRHTFCVPEHEISGLKVQRLGT